MSHIYTIDEIAALVKPVAERYGIERVWLFGSYARGEATEDSDVDFLIDVGRRMGMFELGGIFEDMKSAVRKEIDLVTVSSLYHPCNSDVCSSLRQEIERDKVLMYGKQ